MASSNILGDNSQRRNEALKFLSCISLDGTYVNPVLYFQNKKGHNGTKRFDNLMKNDLVKEICNVEHVAKKCFGRKVVSDTDDNFSSSDTDDVDLYDKPKLNKKVLCNSLRSKKRVRTANSKSGATSKIISTEKKVRHSSTCSDSEHQYESSCENICPETSTDVITSRLKTKASTCNAIAELGGNAKINFIKSIQDYKSKGERIFMVTKNRVPFLVCSFIPYRGSDRTRSDIQKETVRKRHTSRSRPPSTVSDVYNPFELFGIVKSEDGQEESYGKLLVPSCVLKENTDKKYFTDATNDQSNNTSGKIRQGMSRCYSYDQTPQKGTVRLATSPTLLNSKENIVMPPKFVYTPTTLDDPELLAGKHRTLLTFSSYITSIIDFVRPDDLKKEINDKFREKFPYIKLTLSKLRSIKKEMCKIARIESSAELLTVAQSFVYFEKLILRGLINKQNRKLCAGASLLLSAKLNDVKGDVLNLLIERIENIFRFNRRELFEAEFAVLVALEFGLHIPASEIFPHYQRLLYES